MRPLLFLPLIALAPPAMAQETPQSQADGMFDDEDDIGPDLERHGNEILVVATRLRGEIETTQPAILTLEEEDVASYGVASIDELLTALAPQTGSGSGRGDGRPVVLLNGQRISSFREMRDIPPEAIRRVQVLPEEVALKFGYPATQRVVNFILKDNFTSKTLAGEYNVPTRGGFAESELEGGFLRIKGKGRLNLSAKIEDTSMLTEAERGIIQEENSAIPAGVDAGDYRSLVADGRDILLNGTWATGLGEGAKAASLSINGAFTRTNSRSLSGLDTQVLTAPDGSLQLRALTRDSQTDKFETGLGFNKPVFSAWQLTATIDASHSDTETLVDRRTGGGTDLARTKDLSANSLATLAGSPFKLPAGEASLTVRAGFAYSRSDNSDTRNTSSGDVRLNRGNLSSGFNLALPITSRRLGVLDDVGDITLNLSAGIDHLSDFGDLIDWSAGLSWSPTEKLGFQLSYTINEEAPSLGQLGNPQIATFNSPVYDFSRGETVLVTVLSGGNPNLLKETQRDIKVGANWQLPFLKNSNLIAEYFHNRSEDVTQNFPLLTPAIEAAFPDRIVRDASGQLVSIDRRAVTFSEIESSRLRWGFNIGGEFGKATPQPRDNIMSMIPGGPRPGGQGAGGPGGGGGPRAGGPGMGGPRGPGGPGGRGPGANNGRGRWNLSVYHTLRFTDTVQVAPGSPVLNLLKGEAIADGGVARHSFQMEGGVFHKGFGVRLRGDWTAPTHVNASGAPGSSDLRFGAVFDLGARIFVNFDQQKSVVEKIPLLKGTRLSFEFQDIFDSRQKVTDASGAVPLAYQAAYRDARGRFIGIDIRKIF